MNPRSIVLGSFSVPKFAIGSDQSRSHSSPWEPGSCCRFSLNITKINEESFKILTQDSHCQRHASSSTVVKVHHAHKKTCHPPSRLWVMRRRSVCMPRKRFRNTCGGLGWNCRCILDKKSGSLTFLLESKVFRKVSTFVITSQENYSIREWYFESIEVKKTL
jgi:hypothetical protein